METTATRHSEMLRARVFSHRVQIKTLAKEFGVRNVRLFGSVAQGSAGDGSDIDLLVDPAGIRTLFQLVELQSRLAVLLENEVDLVLSTGIKANRRNELFESQMLSIC